MMMTTRSKSSARWLWLAVAAGFLLLGAAWSALFVAARRARIESVPLAAQPGRTAP
jgi:hypothetical protein